VSEIAERTIMHILFLWQEWYFAVFPFP
jgi:hypothetical protein